MSLYKKVTFNVGNIVNSKVVPVSAMSVKCPICLDWCDAEIDDDGDVFKTDCDCNIDDFICKDEHEEIVDVKNEEIAELQERIEELEGD